MDSSSWAVEDWLHVRTVLEPWSWVLALSQTHMRKLRFRDAKCCCQGHTAGKLGFGLRPGYQQKSQVDIMIPVKALELEAAKGQSAKGCFSG